MCDLCTILGKIGNINTNGWIHVNPLLTSYDLMIRCNSDELHAINNRITIESYNGKISRRDSNNIVTLISIINNSIKSIQKAKGIININFTVGDSRARSHRNSEPEKKYRRM